MIFKLALLSRFLPLSAHSSIINDDRYGGCWPGSLIRHASLVQAINKMFPVLPFFKWPTFDYKVRPS